MKVLDNHTFFKKPGEYVLNLLKWIFLSVLVGAACAGAGALFHYAVDIGAHYRDGHPYILYALPLSGLVIVFLYHVCGMDDDKGTNTIINAVRNGDKISILLAPVILIATAITHLFGGSSGREGAALQIGGSIASFFARMLHLKNYNSSVLIMCGMSGLFSAVFGTPLAASVFALEVVSVGIMHYGALFPAIISAVTAQTLSHALGVEKTAFTIMEIPAFETVYFVKVIVLALLCALLSIVFITFMHEATHLFAKYVKNKYLRIFIGGTIVVLLTLIVGSYDYNGAGMEVIVRAIDNGSGVPYAFILKMIFTVVTLACGFKGGEIVPTFFIGSTFGLCMASVLGLNPSFAAAIGLIALFCGVVNCPVASVFLSIELFGAEGMIYFAAAAAASYFFSGNCSLYSAQKIVYSKLRAILENSDN